MQGSTVYGRKTTLCIKLLHAFLPPSLEFRDEGQDILIVARTDAREAHGLEEALERCREFRRIGADITFLDAPENEDDMRRYCKEVDGPKLAIMLEVMLNKGTAVRDACY